MSNQDRKDFSSSATPLFSWLNGRSAGVLLHPTAFPGEQGIGVLSGAADSFLGFLAQAGVHYWQICPLGPTGYGDSPYQCFSSFAGNPYLIDLEALPESELLSAEDLAPLAQLPKDRVDFAGLYRTKWPLLFKAYTNFAAHGSSALKKHFSAFKTESAEWLKSFSYFCAIKAHFGGRPWWEWPEELRFYSRAVHTKLFAQLSPAADAHAFFQFLFFGQWARVRERAQALGVEIIGDTPIFVARDSADVWAHPELFQIDQSTGALHAVAGVPPDYFSADGQLWGNPLYDWPAHAQDGYAWWVARLRANFKLCDAVRIDHFRGFDTYWSIPSSASSARDGIWKQGPGLDFFKAIQAALPQARLIAEDLGELFPSVITLRESTGLPGMAVLQFAFGGDATNLYLPHNLNKNSVIYTGTHDNDTALGWYASADEKARDHVRRYLRVDGHEIGWDLIRAAYASVSRLAIIPLQDILSLGTNARFNTPGVPSGNWQWRYSSEQFKHLAEGSSAYLRSLAMLYDRQT